MASNTICLSKSEPSSSPVSTRDSAGCSSPVPLGLIHTQGRHTELPPLLRCALRCTVMYTPAPSPAFLKMTLFGTADYCTGTVPAAFECNATGKGLVDGALRSLSMDLSYDKVLFHSLSDVYYMTKSPILVDIWSKNISWYWLRTPYQTHSKSSQHNFWPQ